MYKVSLNYLQQFQRYAPYKLFIAKIKKGSNSVNTGDRVMVLAFCSFPYGPVSVCQVSLNYLQYALYKSVTDGQSGDYTYALPLGSIKIKSYIYHVILLK